MLYVVLLVFMSFSLGAVENGESATNKFQSLEFSDQKELNGDVFIIPNGLCKGRDINAFFDVYKKYGIAVNPEELFVQVWATSSKAINRKLKSDNWSCHGTPLIDSQFPADLPVSFFEGKKEGDVITFEHENDNKEKIKISLTMRQNDYRYANCAGVINQETGKWETSFEQCLAALKKNYERDNSK